MILVIAGDKRQFHYWCHQHSLIPSPNCRQVKHVTKPDDMRGYANPDTTLVFVGTWRQHWLYEDSAFLFLYLKNAVKGKVYIAEDADLPW